MGRYFAKGRPKSRNDKPRRRRRRIRLIPFVFMIVGMATVLVAAFRYLIVLLLVYLGGRV